MEDKINQYGDNDVVTHIKLQKKKWAGHVHNMRIKEYIREPWKGV